MDVDKSLCVHESFQVRDSIHVLTEKQGECNMQNFADSSTGIGCSPSSSVLSGRILSRKFATGLTEGQADAAARRASWGNVTNPTESMVEYPAFGRTVMRMGYDDCGMDNSLPGTGAEIPNSVN
jgi:hypothetical protein